MSQLELEAVMAVDSRLAFYAGYCFGWRTAWKPLSRYVSGVVVTPSYAVRAAKEVDASIPLILDNGAWSAFASGYHLTMEEMVQKMQAAIETVGPDRFAWTVLPDVVGNAALTARRISDSARRWTPLNSYGIPELLPVQEGMDLRSVACIAQHRGGIFVGGRTRRWKLQAARYFQHIAPDLHVHIGRISGANHLGGACVAGANSFDTTTYMQQRGTNVRTDYHPRFKRYVQRRRWLTQDEINLAAFY